MLVNASFCEEDQSDIDIEIQSQTSTDLNSNIKNRIFTLSEN